MQASHKRDVVTQLFLQFHTSWRNEEVKNWNFNQLKVLCWRGALSFIVFLQHCDERTQILPHAVCLQQISWANSWQEWEVQINLAAVRCSPFSKGKTESTSFFIYFLSFLAFFYLWLLFRTLNEFECLCFVWPTEVFLSVWHWRSLLGQNKCYERAPFLPSSSLLMQLIWSEPLFSHSIKISNCTFQAANLHVNYCGGGGRSLWSSEVRPGDMKEASQEKKKSFLLTWCTIRKYIFFRGVV